MTAARALCGLPAYAPCYVTLATLKQRKGLLDVILAMVKLYDDLELSQELRHRGLGRARQFSWDIFADDIVKAIRRRAITLQACTM